MTPGTNSNMQLALANATPREKRQLERWYRPKMKQLYERYARQGAARTELELTGVNHGNDTR